MSAFIRSAEDFAKIVVEGETPESRLSISRRVLRAAWVTDEDINVAIMLDARIVMTPGGREFVLEPFEARSE